MTHLEFLDHLGNLGIWLMNKQKKRYEIVRPVSGDLAVIIKCGFDLMWEKPDSYGEPLNEIIKMAIDIDTFKESIHYKIVPENYNEFKKIIQQKIIARAQDIELLSDVYFQLIYELSREKMG